MKRSRFSSFVLILIWTILGCASEAPTIHFRLEDGFRGDFVIVQNDEKGAIIQSKNGSYVLSIPKNGVLVIKKGCVPFDQWHTTTMEFRTGKTIPSGVEGNLPIKVVAWWGLSSSKNTIRYFIGTKKERDQVNIENLKLWK